MRNTLIVAILVLGAAVLVPSIFNSKNHQPTSSTQTGPVETGPEFSFQQVNEKFVSSGRLSDAQKKEEWEKYKGKRVEWQGEVTDVKTSMGNTSIHLRHLQTTADQDVNLNLRKDQSQKAGQVHEGQILKYQGNLSLFGSLFGLTLDDGVIVN